MKIIQKLEKTISFTKSMFFNGLFTLLPITATIFFVSFTFNLLGHWFSPLKKIEPIFLQKVPGIEIIIVTLFILLIGALVKFLIITPIIHHFEKIIDKIPLIRTIYSSAKILGDFFRVSSPNSQNKKVVLVEFPKKGTFNMAFLLESAEDNFGKIIKNKYEDKKYFKVFMPNSPNPSTGFFLVLPEEDIIDTNITFEEAIKAIVSCGLITPETLKRNV